MNYMSATCSFINVRFSLHPTRQVAVAGTKTIFSTFIFNECFKMIGKARFMTRSLGIIRNSVAHPDVFPSSSSFIPLYPLQVRQRSTTPLNTIIMFVPQQEAWIVERMGKFHRILEPGFNMLVPIIDKIKYVQSLKEIAIDVPKQSAITADNVTLDIDGVLYLRINDPYLTSYGVEDPEFAIIQLAQTTMRSELGKISLDNVFREREGLNVNIVASINKASEVWGITCLRYEIRDIRLPTRVQEAMQMQVEAERRKRAAILESEGIRTADINVAEGKRQSRILASEAEKQEQINKASGEAAALLAVAEARAKSLQMVANALSLQDGKDAASLSIAEQYVRAFNKLAKTSNTLIIPSNVSDISGVVTQAMSIYKHILPSRKNQSQLHNQTKFDENNETDEVYEYYSDKEEAEKHKEIKSQSSKLL